MQEKMHEERDTSELDWLHKLSVKDQNLRAVSWTRIDELAESCKTTFKVEPLSPVLLSARNLK